MQVARPVVVVQEARQAIVAALHHMLRYSGQIEPREAGHAMSFAAAAENGMRRLLVLRSETSDQRLREVNLTPFSAELRQIISELEEVKNLGGEAKAELAAEIGTLKSQCESPKPKAGIVKESLGSVRRILEEAGGNLMAAGLLPSLTRLLGAF
ncbi:MAG: hypothetical protein AMXMBFR59_40020 [Rhodanobacteraceae bacterium]